MFHRIWIPAFAGAAAGIVSVIFGGGGGMVFILIMSLLAKASTTPLFSSSVAVILPICIISIILYARNGMLFSAEALPWLPGSAIGGYLAAKFGKKIPDRWLHKGLGILILYGGVKYLC